MAGRSKYSDHQRASVYVTLMTNDGNVKRTARDLGMPISTVRDMKKQFDLEGPPSEEFIEVAAGEFLDTAEKTRDEALGWLRKKLPDANPQQLATIIGILDDKISRAKGLADRTVEHRHSLPSPDEIRAAMAGVVQGAIESSKRREEDIVDVEILELPAGS